MTFPANNSTLSIREDDAPVQMHGYKTPLAIRCDIDDIGPTAHGDGIELLVKHMMREMPDQPPIMAPGMSQRVGCYFGAVIWWEAKPCNTHRIAMDNWEFIWHAAEDIKTHLTPFPEYKTEVSVFTQPAPTLTTVAAIAAATDTPEA
ncbi:hypothetical protein N0V82_004137 [Gnomoniopsis sp. IMI 355080]|nr:hypothetical protein N0V82_004137 [Gnomoniopsis sp. IMI 355080]